MHVSSGCAWDSTVSLEMRSTRKWDQLAREVGLPGCQMQRSVSKRDQLSRKASLQVKPACESDWRASRGTCEKDQIGLEKGQSVRRKKIHVWKRLSYLPLQPGCKRDRLARKISLHASKIKCKQHKFAAAISLQSTLACKRDDAKRLTCKRSRLKICIFVASKISAQQKSNAIEVNPIGILSHTVSYLWLFHQPPARPGTTCSDSNL